MTSTDHIRSKLSTLFRSLRHRNYRLFYIGQGISLIGTWMQQIAMTWLVYRITGSAFMLGVFAFSSQLPVFVISPFAGVFADRWNRRRILIVEQSIAMTQALVLALLTLTNMVAVWHIVILGILLGMINSIDMPVRQSFMIEMIDDRNDLANAIALNSSLVNTARLIGPSIAGIIVAAFGEGICFLLNGISFIAVLIALLRMNVKEQIPSTEEHQTLQKLREGFLYVSRFRPIRSILLLLALTSLMGVQPVLMPVFVKDILHGGPHTFGFLMAAMGLGALSGAVYLASRKNVVGLGRRIVIAAVTFGAGLIILSSIDVFSLSVVCMYLTGLGMMVQMASSNMILQTISDDDKRGRVMSFYAMAFVGMAPFGSLMAGSLATAVGVQWTLALDGVICITGALLFARDLPAIRKILRPIYIKMGIISDMPSET
jgi:MFS family permease